MQKAEEDFNQASAAYAAASQAGSKQVEQAKQGLTDATVKFEAVVDKYLDKLDQLKTELAQLQVVWIKELNRQGLEGRKFNQLMERRISESKQNKKIVAINKRLNENETRKMVVNKVREQRENKELVTEAIQQLAELQKERINSGNKLAKSFKAGVLSLYSDKIKEGFQSNKHKNDKQISATMQELMSLKQDSGKLSAAEVKQKVWEHLQTAATNCDSYSKFTSNTAKKLRAIADNVSQVSVTNQHRNRNR